MGVYPLGVLVVKMETACSQVFARVRKMKRRIGRQTAKSSEKDSSSEMHQPNFAWHLPPGIEAGGPEQTLLQPNQRPPPTAGLQKILT